MGCLCSPLAPFPHDTRGLWDPHTCEYPAHMFNLSTPSATSRACSSGLLGPWARVIPCPCFRVRLDVWGQRVFVSPCACVCDSPASCGSRRVALQTPGGGAVLRLQTAAAWRRQELPSLLYPAGEARAPWRSGAASTLGCCRRAGGSTTTRREIPHILEIPPVVARGKPRPRKGEGGYSDFLTPSPKSHRTIPL